jgi:hypothetical protein
MLTEKDLCLVTQLFASTFEMNGNIERPNRTIAERVRDLLTDSACLKKDWCYAAEHSADLYRFTLHSAIYMSPHEAWYGERYLATDIHIWGCRVLVPNHDTKKSDNRAALGQFYRYANAVRFFEIDPTRPVITPGQQLLCLDPTASPNDIDIPLVSIYVSNRVHFETEPLSIQVPLPPVGTRSGLQLEFDETYHLPYITHVNQTTDFVQDFPIHFCRSVYVLAINGYTPISVDDVLDAFKQCQNMNAVIEVQVLLVKRNASARTDIEEQIMMFDQVCFVSVPVPVSPDAVACRAVTSLYRPECPENIEHMMNIPVKEGRTF